MRPSASPPSGIRLRPTCGERTDRASVAAPARCSRSPPVASGDAGGYDVVLTNPSGSITSLVATLTVGVALVNPSFEADTFSVYPGYLSRNGPLTAWNTRGAHAIHPTLAGSSP